MEIKFTMYILLSSLVSACAKCIIEDGTHVNQVVGENQLNLKKTTYRHAYKYLSANDDSFTWLIGSQTSLFTCIFNISSQTKLTSTNNKIKPVHVCFKKV
jgi:hypothetical protein